MRLMRLVLGVGLLVSGCAGSTRASSSSSTIKPTGGSASRNPFRIGRPLIIPHGGGEEFPDDTLYAYQHSLALGGDVVDADVQVTADDIPIAFNDSTLERTTNGTGPVSTKSYAQLATLDAGWGFTRDSKHPFRGKGLTIPTIESLLDAFPHRLFTLDLKDLRTSAVEPLCDLLQSSDRSMDVYIGVDSNDQVALFRRLCPNVHTSGTDAERRAARTAMQNHDTVFVSDQEVNQPEYIGADGTVRVTSESLAFAHSHDTAVLTWVVDDPEQMRTLIAMGVDGIYTGRPDVMRAVMREMGIEQ